MTTIYCQIINGAVTTIYGCPQDPSDKPGYTELPDSDPCWLAYQAARSAAAANVGIDAQIAALEVRQGRALREHALGSADALTRLQTLDAQIAALRTQRVAG